MADVALTTARDISRAISAGEVSAEDVCRRALGRIESAGERLNSFNHIAADRALERALQQDVAFVPGWPFYAGEADRRTLRLSFTTHTPEEIADGLVRLGTALR